MQQFKRNGAFDQAHYKIKYMGRILNLKSAVIPPPSPYNNEIIRADW